MEGKWLSKDRYWLLQLRVLLLERWDCGQMCEIWMLRLAGQSHCEALADCEKIYKMLRCSSCGRECGAAERETRACLKRTCTDISDEERQPFHFLHIGVFSCTFKLI